MFSTGTRPLTKPTAKVTSATWAALAAASASADHTMARSRSSPASRDGAVPCPCLVVPWHAASRRRECRAYPRGTCSVKRGGGGGGARVRRGRPRPGRRRAADYLSQDSRRTRAVRRPLEPQDLALRRHPPHRAGG